MFCCSLYDFVLVHCAQGAPDELALLKHKRQSEKQLLLSTCFTYVLIEIKFQNPSSEKYEFFCAKYEFLDVKIWIFVFQSWQVCLAYKPLY